MVKNNYLPDCLVVLTEEVRTHAMPAEKVLAQTQHIVAILALTRKLLWLLDSMSTGIG